MIWLIVVFKGDSREVWQSPEYDRHSEGLLGRNLPDGKAGNLLVAIPNQSPRTLPSFRAIIFWCPKHKTEMTILSDISGDEKPIRTATKTGRFLPVRRRVSASPAKADKLEKTYLINKSLRPQRRSLWQSHLAPTYHKQGGARRICS